jgi:hypothetical protein
MAGVTAVWVRWWILKGDGDAYRKTKFDSSFTQCSISVSVDNISPCCNCLLQDILTVHQLPLVHAVDVAQEAI